MPRSWAWGWDYLHGQLSGRLKNEGPQRSVSRLCSGVLTLCDLRIRLSLLWTCREGASAWSRRLAVQQLQHGQAKRQGLP